MNTLKNGDYFCRLFVHQKNLQEEITMNDEIIDEVRAIKEAIGAKFNYNLRALFEEIKRGETESQAKGINLVLPPANPEKLPTSALQRGKTRRRQIHDSNPA